MQEGGKECAQAHGGSVTPAVSAATAEFVGQVSDAWPCLGQEEPRSSRKNAGTPPKHPMLKAFALPFEIPPPIRLRDADRCRTSG
jgi:hypothetical protein